MTRSLLVYDDSAAWLRAAATGLSACSTDLMPVPWRSREVQAFLDAQFGARPFALVLIEGDSVHVGARTVTRTLRRLGLSPSLVRLFGRAYPAVAGPFGRVVHGREPTDLHGTFTLTAAAREHVEPLRRAQLIPVDSE